MEDLVKQVVETRRQAMTRRERGSFKLKSETQVELGVGSLVSSPSGAASSSDQLSPAAANSVQPLIPPAASFGDTSSLVKRTFIHVQIPSGLRSLSSVSPATM